MTLAELIINYRQSHDLSQRQFAAKCGLSNGYISMLEKGVNPNTQEPLIPSLGALGKIAGGLGVSLDYLFLEVEDLPVFIADERYKTIPPGFEPLPETERKPLVGAIACGDPILAEENIEDYVDVPKGKGIDFCLTCKGDSMIDAGIQDGDIVYIHQTPQVENGQIAAVRIGDEATLKRFYFDGETVTLIPANSKYPPRSYTGEAINDIHIEGRAVGFTHWMK